MSEPQVLADAHAVYREDDGEFVGYAVPAGDRWQPLTMFGYPLAGPMDHADAVAELEARGLACMIERWQVYWPAAGEWNTCEIMETRPGWVRVRNSDPGSPDCGTVMELTDPGPDQLRLR